MRACSLVWNVLSHCGASLHAVFPTYILNMSNLALAVGQRKQFRTAITRIHNDKDNFQAYPEIKKLQTKLKLERMEKDIEMVNSEILQITFADSTDGLQEYLDLCEEYKDKLIECISLLNPPPSHVSQPVITGAGSGVNAAARSLLKSPTAPLPRFTSAIGENLEMFFHQFEETLSKFTYTEYDKLLLLKQQISGKASLLIDSLESDKQTYTEAKNLLMTALASAEIQKFNVLRQLSEMKLLYNGEPFQYIADMRKIMQAFKSLKVTIDDVMQYFFLLGMNESFKNHLTLITQTLRPSVEEIMDKFFVANERYESAKKISKASKMSSKDETETVSHVVSAKMETKNNVNPFENCSLCKTNNNHPINKCTQYATRSDKLNRLKALRGCTKCANSEHSSEKCSFRFRKSCHLCSKWHFSFLCPDMKENGKPRIPSNSKNSRERQGYATAKETKCNIISASFFSENVEVDSALATFNVNGRKNDLVRGLFDNGSQSSFISESHLKNFDHSIVKNHVNLTIKGINETKTFRSKLVKTEIKFGEKICSLELLMVPSIDINLGLPLLSPVVEAFKDKNIALADKLLTPRSKYLDNFGLLLGANAAFCFEGQTLKFGNNSAYLETKFGALLLGSLGDMLSDMDHLNIGGNSVESVTNVITHVNAIGLGFYLDEPSVSTKSVANNEDYKVSMLDGENISFEKCSEKVLEKTCSEQLNKESLPSHETCELNANLVKYLLNTVSRDEEGRQSMPLLWNSKVKHLLAKNYNLAQKVLQSNFKKFSNDSEKMLMIDSNIRELEEAGIVERIGDLHKFMEENPTCSFLPHNSIFKLSNETTKVRTVFMSNLSEKFNNQVSHNQAMHSGPSINHKLTSALILLRFDSKLLCFDLRKAFLQISLGESDQNKLLFLWYRNVEKGDYTIQAFKNLRLPFGLKCSPCILMVTLYKMLVLNCDEDDENLTSLKKTHLLAHLHGQPGGV